MKTKPSHLRPVADNETAGVTDAQEQIAAQLAAIQGAAAAAKAGTATDEQKALIASLAAQAVKATGVAADQLKTVDRTITLVTPTGIPITVKVSDIGEALSAAETVTALPGKTASGAVGGFARVLAWVNDNPRTAAGIAVVAVGAYFLTPVLVPIVLARASRR